MQMFKNLISLFTLAAAVVVQEPGPATTAPPSMVCNRDNCLRAAIASNAKPGPVTAGLECAAFVASQQPVTITVVSGSTQIISPSPTGPLSSTISNACGGSPSRYLSACMCRGYTRSTTTVTPTTSAAVSTFGSGCNADNCLRGIFGVNAADANRASRLADCSAFVPNTAENPLPTYASACSGDTRSRYASVCNCVGVTAPTGSPSD